MKKNLVIGLLVLLMSASNVFAGTFKEDVQKINNIGFKLLNDNSISQRLVFDLKNIPNQGPLPFWMDYSRYADYNLHNNRVVTVYIDDFCKMTSDDEVAALLAHNIAQGVHSYKGILNGQIFFTKDGSFWAKPNELNYDKQAVDYLVKSGYNPVAIITAYEKVLPEWRGTLFKRHNMANKRMLTVYRYIDSHYPQYLNNNEYTQSSNFIRFKNRNSLK